MSSIIAAAIDAALAAAKPVQEHAIILRRGDDETEITAVLGDTRVEVIDQDGITARVRIRDYLIDRGDYQFAGVVTEPQAGDEIDDGPDRFEVAKPSGGEQPWVWSTRHRSRYRIHTREISAD